MYDVTHRVTQFTGAREFTSGSVSLLQGRSEFLDLFMDSERPANLNSAVPACITKEYVPKVTPSYQAGHEPKLQLWTKSSTILLRSLAWYPLRAFLSNLFTQSTQKVRISVILSHI